jgi:hypothetical protein
MLNDIFARRYEAQQLWPTLNEKMRRLLVQGFKLLDERVCPYYVNGNENETGKAFWKELQSRLSTELGLVSLSPLAYAYPSTFNGKPFTQTGTWTMIKVCENWFMAPLHANADANRYILERLSLVEIGFRMREEKLAYANAALERNIEAARNRIPSSRGITLPGDIGEGMRVFNKKLNADFQSTADELNVRFRQAESGLHYHNGFIQLATDPTAVQQIEAPFWRLVGSKRWVNVDTDMKEAVDRRDTNGRDPAFYAARALESTIKIVSSAKGWTTGKERGAHNYIDNLKGAKFIENWEAEILKSFFANIRNPLGHGPGDQPMTTLSPELTAFAIESAMVWINLVVRRAAL